MSMHSTISHTTRMEHRAAARKPDISHASRDALAAQPDEWVAGTAAMV